VSARQTAKKTSSFKPRSANLETTNRAGLILTRLFPLSLLFHAQSPLPSRPHSWLPSTNPVTFPWLPYTSFNPSCRFSLLPLFPPLSCPLCRAFNCRILYGHSFMPLTVIFIIISFPSSTHSFIPDLKPSFSANPSHCRLSFCYSGLTT